MSETHSTSISGSSTWTEEEIRQQPDSWIRALKIWQINVMLSTPFLRHFYSNPTCRLS